MEGWIENLVWTLAGVIVGELIWQVRGWIRAKATHELAQALAVLHNAGRYREADKVKLP